MQFQPAIKSKSKARVGLIGPSGSGKTFTSLRIATGLAGDGRIAVIDTEHGSASKYADLFQFDVLELDDFSPDVYVKAIELAERAGYDVVIIDSLSHAWIGKNGALDQVDSYARRNNNNSFGAWRLVTPKHNALVEALVGCHAHVIATMRSKTEYVIEKSKGGKSMPRKVGTAPIQRDGMEYEFDVVGELDQEHLFVVTKTRCHLLDNRSYDLPGEALGELLGHWLDDGEAPPPRPKLEVVKPEPEVKAPTPPPEPALDVSGICKRRAEVVRDTSWSAEDLAAYLAEWHGELGGGHWPQIVASCEWAAGERLGQKRVAIRRDILQRLGVGSYDSVERAAFARAWVSVACPDVVELTIESESSDEAYTVALQEGKAKRCSCPAGVHGKRCKHLPKAEEMLRHIAALEALPGIGKAGIVKVLDEGWRSVDAVHQAVVENPQALSSVLGEKSAALLVEHFAGEPKGTLQRVLEFAEDAKSEGLDGEARDAFVIQRVLRAVCMAANVIPEEAEAWLQKAAGCPLVECDARSLAAAWETVAKGVST